MQSQLPRTQQRFPKLPIVFPSCRDLGFRVGNHRRRRGWRCKASSPSGTQFSGKGAGVRQQTLASVRLQIPKQLATKSANCSMATVDGSRYCNLSGSDHRRHLSDDRRVQLELHN